ncbi:glucokinase [Thiomicrorhabdus sp. zzn3]|uniref:glucokinase n=1 Tax=Thiomicrorhabdus sp. zzn3 TaxID=3039775 RepID=UPI00243635F4|nr:glucokinase [Thiomicrorhabdus sp. zzn3]MDG6777348.1 glucokinase [Thiomicrorhabdus sp. zzn3]
MRILAGDIGGTKAQLQLIECRRPGLECARHFNSLTQLYSANPPANLKVIGEQRFVCAEFESLESIVNAFLDSLELNQTTVDVACFGLPGPVDGDRVELTNLPWILESHQIQQACSISKVLFINDFHAAALGVQLLRSDQLTSLYPSVSTPNSAISGHHLVIGAGTGLGVAPVYFDGKQSRPVAHEGGHFDFAPISDTQVHLLSWLWQQYEHVSYERILSGPGLEALYHFFSLYDDCPTSYQIDASQNLKKNRVKTVQNNSMGSVIAEELSNDGRSKSFQPLSAEQIYVSAELGDPVAEKAMIEFVTVYGAFVGAAALFWNAFQGVYLAGGIASKISKWMQMPYFRQAYLEKGRMTKVVASRPVFIVNDPGLGVKGAALFAVQALADGS